MNNGEIAAISFGIWSADEILKTAVCKITNSKTEGEESVYDERMGSMTADANCVSCGLSTKECPGHFGCIVLKYPILHPMYYKLIVNFLKCFCAKCYKFLLTKEHLRLEGVFRYQGESRFLNILEKMEKIDFCYHCDTPKPKIVFVASDSSIYMVYKKTKILLVEEDIKKIFDNISEDDVRLLGFNPAMVHPKNTIITVLPVIPPVSRPWVPTEGATCDDDLTIQYQEIVKCNQHLSEEGLPESKIQKHLQTLKFRVKTLINNSQSKARHTNGRPIKDLKKRISGKDGIIRNNLMGKRVDQSGRTVIGPDPTVRTDELVVPDKMAATLTKPERVTSFNINKLRQLVNEGKASQVKRMEEEKDENGRPIIQKDGTPRMTWKTHNLEYSIFKRGTELHREDKVFRNGKELQWQFAEKFALRRDDKIIRNGKEVAVEMPYKKMFDLRIGDIVHRQLQTGDVVMFNRQPTLHKGSMLAKRIIVRPGKTLRFSLASAKTFNADYDGDEMNIHAVQDCDATAELMMLSSTKANMFSPQASKSNLSIVMDALLASYLMSRDDTPLRRDQFYNICMHGDGWSSQYILDRIQHFKEVCAELKERGELKDKDGNAYDLSPFCGKGLISMMLPRTFNYSKKTDACPSQPFVKVYKGVMYSGALNKSILGASQNAWHQILYKEYNADVAMDLLNNIQFIGSAYLLVRGFSIGIVDCIPKKTNLIQDTISKAYVQAKQISETIQHPKIREGRINNTLSKAKDVGMKIAKESMDPDNGFIATVTSGSKGDYFNIAQISGVIGQNELEGGRIKPTLNNNKRTLYHYKFEENDVEREFESRGFIKNSFMKGLNVREFFLHAMSGREGVSDTAMKTAQSGYIQRRMIKMMEDLQVKYDDTVRNSYGSIVQWAYGEDGLDRSQTVVLKEKAQIADLSRIADRINMKYKK